MNYIHSLFGLPYIKFRDMNWEGHFKNPNKSSDLMEQHVFSRESQARTLISKFNELCSCSYRSQDRWAQDLDSKVKSLPTNTDDLEKLEVVFLSPQAADLSKIRIVYHRSNQQKTSFFAEVVNGCLKPDPLYSK